MRFLLRLTLPTLLVATAVSFFGVYSFVGAVSTSEAVFQKNCEANPNTSFCKSVQSEEARGNRIAGPDGILTAITKFVVYITGAVSIVMVIVGGIKYTLASGNSEAVSGAKRTIMYALIGLAVAILSQAIVTFVLSRL